MSNETKQSPLEILIAEKMAAGLPRATAEICAQQQLDHDAALEAATEPKAPAKSKK